MILADKIINERKRNAWSQEELADKLGVSRQAVSKWESAQSVPDIQRVIQMAQLFGVSTDYLLKDEYDATENNQSEPVSYDYDKSFDEPIARRLVSLEEANAFLECRKAIAPKIALAVFMCIVSPVLLIVLAGLAECSNIGLSEGVAAAVGIVMLLLLVAVAVFIFITTGYQAEKFAFLEKEPIETAYGVTGMVKTKKAEYEPMRNVSMAIGVIMCILSPVPLLVASCLGLPELTIVMTVAILLFLVAVGVYLIVNCSMVYSSYTTLLEEGEYTVEAKKNNQRMERIGGVYWGLATAIYLAWSFLTGEWGITWIIWVLAGVLFAPISALVAYIKK